jgi:hypothetical protein
MVWCTKNHVNDYIVMKQSRAIRYAMELTSKTGGN